MKSTLLVLLAAVSAALSLQTAPVSAAGRPNILWITCEDTGPHLGSYGDQYAVTPNLDALAGQSVRYTRAFAYTGVCAPSRSCLITGVYPTRLGSHHMRSATRLPEPVKCFTEYLRAAGYYCSNNVKTDYNFPVPRGAWDESGNKAHWRNRSPGQPFFSVFNFTVCHQSAIFAPEAQYRRNTQRLTPEQRRDPALAPVPPYHPDTPEFRTEWARHYENVTAMDYQVGDLLAELEADGLAGETIVFFFSDHGTGMPSVKMFAWDAGLRVPLLIRFPEKWRGLAPADPGQTTDRLVSFVDFAPTVLSLAGVEIPPHAHGFAFLGGRAAPPQPYIYGAKDRQGERYDLIRYVHSGRFQYLRNFMPHLPWGQHISYVHQHASMRAWQQLQDEGKLSGPPARFFQLKPAEELYDLHADPFQTNNLAGNPRHQERLEELRRECRDWMLRTHDLGLLPEYELWRRSEGGTPWNIASDPQLNPLEDLLAAADLANEMAPANLPRLLELLRHPDAAVRWWGVLGLGALGREASAAEPALRAALSDASPDVRVAAAEALANLGHDGEALGALREALRHPSAVIRLAALNALDRMGSRAAAAIPDIQNARIKYPAQPHVADYVGRMVDYVPDRLRR
jgi:N-sulfoglucosamine sulfohydrolase